MASTTAQVSLSNATGTTNGLSVDFATAKRTVSCVIFISGATTGGVVLVEASQDNTNWVPQASYSIDAVRTRSFDSSRGAYRYWRASILDVIKGGGTVSATFMEAD